MSDTKRTPLMLSDYIENLKNSLKLHGDMPVVKSIVFECTGDCYYDFDVGASVDVVEDCWKIFDTDELVTHDEVLVIASEERF